MSARSFRIILSLLSVAFIVSLGCTKKADGIIGPAGPQGAPGNSSGSSKASAITGYIRLLNQYGFSDVPGNDVSVLTKKGDSLISIKTDETGEFKIPSLFAGTYTIRFKKDGYDSFVVNVTHSGGDEDKFIGIVRLDESITTKFTNETVTLIESPFAPYDTFKIIQVNFSFDGPPYTQGYLRNFYVYISRKSDVNDHDYDFWWDNGNSGASYANTYQTNLSTLNIINSNIKYNKGDTVYMKTYFVPPFATRTSWYDINTFQTIAYPYFGDSIVKYFIWPY